MNNNTDFVINGKGVLAGYTGSAKKIIVPEGVTEISDDAFMMSGLEEIYLPAHLKKIGRRAFFQCRALQKIGFPDEGSLEIGEGAFVGCTELVDESGLLILQNRLFAFHGTAGQDQYADIPDEVTAIEDGVFESAGKIHITMSVNCPSWQTSGKAAKYGVARSIIHISDSTLSFRDSDGKIVAKVILANKEETEPKRNGVILSIRCKEDGGFDFAAYDSYFSELSKVSNKIKMALVRVRYPYELSDYMRNVYFDFLKKQGTAAGILLIDENDEDSIELLESNEIFNSPATVKLIEYAQEKKCNSIVLSLLNYQNRKFGSKNNSESYKLTGSAEKKMNTIPVSEWKKKFRWKYKDGDVWITDYIGNDPEVVIPEKIGSKFVTGIGTVGGILGDFPGKHAKKVTIPGWIKHFERGAFCWSMNHLELIFGEGITELPDYIFFEPHHLTICFPDSLQYMNDPISCINKQTDKTKWETIDVIVPRGSFAEKYFADRGIKYTVEDNKMTIPDAVSVAIQANESHKDAISKKKAEKAWKKPKAGSNLVPRYQGLGTEVVFPTDVDGIKINGIADTAGDAPENYRKLKSVVLPEGYTYIGKRAFAGCENLETISLPSTLQVIKTQAFADCPKLKEIILRNNISFQGNDIFSGSNVGTVIFEAKQGEKILPHLFFGCHVEQFVIIGGPFKSNGNVFDYTGSGRTKSEINFPDYVYTNDDFNTLDLRGSGKGNIKKIRSLADFDETKIADQYFKEKIAADKKSGIKTADPVGKAARQKKSSKRKK